MELLLDAGADVNVPDSGYGSVLNEALSYSSDTIIQRHIDAGAVVDAVDLALRLPPRPVSHPDSTEYLQLQEAGVARESGVQLWENLEVMADAQVLDNISSSEHIPALETVHASNNIEVSDSGHILMNVHVMYNISYRQVIPSSSTSRMTIHLLFSSLARIFIFVYTSFHIPKLISIEQYLLKGMIKSSEERT